MSRVPDISDLIRKLYDTPAFRGTTDEALHNGEESRWWGNQEIANAFGTRPVTEDPLLQQVAGKRRGVVLPGQLDTSDFITIDVQGKAWNQIPLSSLPNEFLTWAKKQYAVSDPRHLDITTDMVAYWVKTTGIPGVIFKRVRDAGAGKEGSTQYFVNDLSRRRSRFAEFRDPNSDDLMAGMALSLLGVGGGAAALGADNDSV